MHGDGLLVELSSPTGVEPMPFQTTGCTLKPRFLFMAHVLSNLIWERFFHSFRFIQVTISIIIIIFVVSGNGTFQSHW